MHPLLFNLFGLEIRSYGVMAALGFLSAILTWTWLGRHEKRPEGFASTLGFWLMAGGIIGARLAYVIANWSQYRAEPLTIIRIDQGGLIFYGGLILASVTLILFARRHRQPLWHLADFAIPGLAIGHSLGRVGCFLNGCCYGRPADPAWCGLAYPPGSDPGYFFPNIPLYPVQLIEALGLFLIWLYLLTGYPRRRFDGIIFARYLLLYAPLRFLLEYLRGDVRQTWTYLNTAQLVSIALCIWCGLLMIWLPRRRFDPPRRDDAPAAQPD